MRCSLLTLSCYVDDELDSRRKGEMEAHLVGCARCRAGLAHIREEVDRVATLARVRVVDESAHALMVQLGLLEPDDPLPERSIPIDTARNATMPPWFQGRATASLPWTPERPRREVAPQPRDGEPPLGLDGVPAAHRRLSALEGVPSVPFDVAMLTPGAVVPLTPRSGPRQPLAPAPEAGPPPPVAPPDAEPAAAWEPELDAQPAAPSDPELDMEPAAEVDPELDVEPAPPQDAAAPADAATPPTPLLPAAGPPPVIEPPPAAPVAPAPAPGVLL
ncbi:MAG TPA: zf-HC2 domain-containing protein, partial [Candidatus Dormibacteraeota bacterium]|nr:zf-HC2 domain-containing protein [Candidatus Dormibacteraeota bacterium]